MACDRPGVDCSTKSMRWRVNEAADRRSCSIQYRWGSMRRCASGGGRLGVLSRSQTMVDISGEKSYHTNLKVVAFLQELGND